MSVTRRTHYGRWTILDFLASSSSSKSRRVTARCRCGTVRDVLFGNLRSGISRSCGCLSRELTARRFYKHGASHRTREYCSWRAMLTRCYNPRVKSYTIYGARGIRVCQRWRHNYIAFLHDVGPRPPNTSLERRNVNGNYTPRNCYWATSQQQAWNTQRSRILTYQGVSLPLSEWARRLGLRHAALRTRLQRGWPLAKVLSPIRHAPGSVRPHDQTGEHNACAKLTDKIVREITRRAAQGESQTTLAREFDVTQPTISRRINLAKRKRKRKRCERS